MNQLSTARLTVVLGAFVLSPIAMAGDIEITANWIVGNSSYSNPAAWDIQIVPINGGPLTFNVIVPSNKMIDFDVTGEINRLTLGDTDTITLQSGITFNVLEQLADLLRVRLIVEGGAEFNGGTIPFSYTSVGAPASLDLMRASGPGSALNLPLLTLFDASVSGNYTHTVRAESGAAIDMSGLEEVRPPLFGTLSIVATEGGIITLSNLSRVIQLASGYLMLESSSSGRIALGELLAPSYVHTAGPEFGTGGIFDFKSRFAFHHTNEANFRMAHSIVSMTGTGTQRLEVGGLDIDILCELLSNDNFGLGQLVVGADEQDPSVVALRDDVDNGNSGGQNDEALYLFGLDGDPPLRILGGSTLVLNHLNVYLCDDGTRLLDLFPPDTDIIEYDEGFIELGVPFRRGDANSDGIVNVEDLLEVLQSWGPCPTVPQPCDSDLDCNRMVDVNDLLTVVQNWS